MSIQEISLTHENTTIENDFTKKLDTWQKNGADDILNVIIPQILTCDIEIRAFLEMLAIS